MLLFSDGDIVDWVGDEPYLIPKDHGYNKNIVRSAIQKAMRRGHVDLAVRYAEHMYAVNPFYFWRTLATVVAEDIGIYHEMMFGAFYGMLKEVYKSDFGRKLAMKIIVEACRVPKTRVCCEVSIVYDHNPVDVPVDKLPEVATSAEDVGTRYCALVKAHKMFDKNTVANWMSGDTELAVKTYRACVMSKFDSMHLAYPVVSELLSFDGYVDETSKFPMEVEINGLPSYAYDVHTYLGKRAIKGYFTRLARKHKWLEEIRPVAVEAIGSAIFILEGGRVDRRFTSPNLSELTKAQNHAYMGMCGIPQDMRLELLKLVGSTIPELNESRIWAANT